MSRLALLALALALTLPTAAPTAAEAAPRNGLLAVQPASGHGVVLLRPDGRVVRTVCPAQLGCGRAGRVAWSPDGRRLAIGLGRSVAVVYADGTCFRCVGPGGDALAGAEGFLLSLTGVAWESAQRLLLSALPRPTERGPRRPALLSVASDETDAQTLARSVVGPAARSVRGDLAVVDARGARPLVLLHGRSRRVLARGATEPSWSPDGRRVAMARGGRIVVLDVATGATRTLTVGHAPSWSPDGRWIAFVASGRGGGRPARVRPDGTARALLGTLRARSVSWQPVPSGSAPACARPAGYSETAADGTPAVAGERTGSLLPEESLATYSVLACLTPNGPLRQVVAQSYTAGADASPTGAHLAVLGRHAALFLSSGGREDVFALSIGVADLASGRDVRLARVAEGCAISLPSPGFTLRRLLPTRGGSAVWQATVAPCSPAAATDRLGVLDGARPRLLDSGAAGSITRVVVSGRRVTWRHDGAARSAELGG